ncbi:ABC transporter permease subunit [Cohnella lubricantis]|uniref:ABC transporter permease subunit n=1 Tax=Cohnella lubricantis TaxID=2163172 RepID=A0A841T7M2_9BACL|nr:ABC transporter permease subunit [Cohnella lubricantis]MBB6676902.1 ABC transporter permease subunit [Cohnella lubricantis]MBP2118303.1 peptide/nickel transport system permease protein [Cohnella lubricantis]
MPRILKPILAVPFTLLFIFALAILPHLFQLNGGGGLHLDWSGSMSSVKDYFAGIGTGESFRFISGRKELSFWEQIGGYFRTSLFYIAIGALAGTTIGILVGIYFSLSRAAWLKRGVDLAASIPDFVLIILLQSLVIFVGKSTGVFVFKFASISSKDPAIALPLISSIIIPASYMIRSVALQMKLTMTEDYINVAKSRGFSKPHIVFFHALPNVLPFIKTDINKLLGILIGNMFIVEFLYNLRGVTKLLFTDTFSNNGYQYALAVNGLLALVIVYTVVYVLLRIYLWGWEKVFSR